MTQDEFNAMLQVALAQGLPGGYYTSKFSGEETDAILSGKGMVFLGRYDTVDDVPSPIEEGHYYIGAETPYHVFTYIKGNWIDAGTIEAPAPVYVTVSLLLSGWDNSTNTQTVDVTGVFADETAQLITPVPALSSQSSYYAAGIKCTGQATDQLTFTANTVPTDDLTVYVVIQEVRS